ncbi:hypothetical protein EIP86_007586 [Pleurotus ostreatoroseus]|nr:hypothetical protein EIP86_007586 [Pleurotus ostreatoroseus]
MVKDSETFQESRPAFSDLRTESLRMVFSQVMALGEYYAHYFSMASPCYATWGEEDFQYPAPDLKMLLSGDPSKWNTRVDSFLAILRYPGPYDGSMEFMFERTIRPAIRLLFAQYRDTS